MGARVLDRELGEDLLRATTALCGGIAGTHEYICGALSGGILLIGVLYGRTAPQDSRDKLYELTRRYTTEFVARFGSTICRDLRDHGPYGPKGPLNCRILMGRAAELLLECLKGSTIGPD